ncbi:MAG: 2'-5' RNA ligase family protein [Clostridia bacterium]|nr:2'-5' RNA ligase family protein [Clostridia bacterium]
MYIWTGIDVDSQLAQAREAARRIENEIGFAHSNFTLPLHISLKKSFPAADEKAGDIMDCLARFYQSQSPMEVAVRGIEKEETIIWIMLERSAALNALHDRLLSLLGEKYGVLPHEYDLDYKFHTTLFMDGDRKKIHRAYALIQNVPVPERLRLDRFAVGASATGALGTYRVLRTIERE